MKRAFITLLVLSLLLGALEVALRVFLPSSLEGVTRVALKVPAESDVEVTMPGLLTLNAVRGGVRDVRVESTHVRLFDEVHADIELRMDSAPLIPALGSIKGGTVRMTVPADERDDLLSLLSEGLVQSSEVVDGHLRVFGEVNENHYDLPSYPGFAVPFEGELVLEGADHFVTAWIHDPVIHAPPGPLTDFMAEALSEDRELCLAERFPRGLTLEDAWVNEEGEVLIDATLSPGIMSNLNERILGDCFD